MGAASFLAIALIGWQAWYFPYGGRTAYLEEVMGGLLSYAAEHDGFFPNHGDGPFASLELLYPKHLDDPRCLAGLSGDRRAVVEQLGSGQALDASICSWIYIPGFRWDDPPVAVLWEARNGLGYGGRRLDGHYVGFSDGSHRQIPSARWEQFQADQRVLRDEISRSEKRR